MTPSAALQLIHGQSSTMKPKQQIPGGQYEAPISGLTDHLRYMMRAGRATSTVRQRRAVMCFLYEYLGRDPIDVSVEELEDWCDSLPISQVRWKIAMIKPFYRWLQARGLRADDPSKLVVTPREKRRRPRPIETNPLFDALEHAPIRILPWLLLAAYSGLRSKEICYLMREDFRIHDGHCYLDLSRTKGDYERAGAMPDWMWTILEPLLPESGRCFVGAYGQELKPKALSEAANRYLHSRGHSTLHTLRHWAGTEALVITDNLRVVQEYLGHATPVTTAVYTLVRPEQLQTLTEALPRPNVTFRALAA